MLLGPDPSPDEFINDWTVPFQHARELKRWSENVESFIFLHTFENTEENIKCCSSVLQREPVINLLGQAHLHPQA